MKLRSLKEFILPPGPILSLTLIGLLFLSALLYYRAIQVQRFLEPALAISQPRNEFAQGINRLLLKELGKEEESGVRLRLGSIQIGASTLFNGGNNLRGSAGSTLKKTGRVFLSIMGDEGIGSYVSLIIVSARFPQSPDAELNNAMRGKMQHRAEVILNTIFRLEPDLEKKYGTYFAATAMPRDPLMGDTDLIEFRIIPSELVHIGVLQKLHKYVKPGG